MARKLSAETRAKISRALKGKARGPQEGTSPAEYRAARQARLAYERAAKTTRPFQKGGARFKAIAAAAKARGAKSPEAVAASVLWKKYGRSAATVAKIKAARVRSSAHPGRGFIAARRSAARRLRG